MKHPTPFRPSPEDRFFDLLLMASSVAILAMAILLTAPDWFALLPD